MEKYLTIVNFSVFMLGAFFGALVGRLITFCVMSVCFLILLFMR